MKNSFIVVAEGCSEHLLHLVDSEELLHLWRTQTREEAPVADRFPLCCSCQGKPTGSAGPLSQCLQVQLAISGFMPGYTDPTIIWIRDHNSNSNASAVCNPSDCLRLRDHMIINKPKDRDSLPGSFQCQVHVVEDEGSVEALIQAIIATPLPPMVLFFENPVPCEFRELYLGTKMVAVIEGLLESLGKEPYGQSLIDWEETKVRLRRISYELRMNDAELTSEKQRGWAVGVGHTELPLPPILEPHKSSWRTMPWLQGEIYFNLLVWHITYAAYLKGSGLKAAVEVGSVLTADGYRSWAIPASTLQNIADLAGAPPAFDMYLEEKTSVTETFFESHIRPMVEQVEGFLQAHAGGAEGTEVSAEIRRLLSACVWGNAVDLALFNNAEMAARRADAELGGNNASSLVGHAADHTVLDAKVVANDMGAAADYLQGRLRHYGAGGAGPAVVDVVMDNMGVECAADLLLGLVLTSLGPLKVRYHTKPVPYYVSDVMPQDIERMLARWEADEATVSSAKRFRAALASGSIEVHTHPFWVHPSEYRDMPASVAGRYFFEKRLEASSHMLVQHAVITPLSDMIILKGELNFRRICGDRHWTPDMFHKEYLYSQSGAHTNKAAVTFRDVIQDYWPYAAVPMLSLRTLKSEVCAEVPKEVLDHLDTACGLKWRYSGTHAAALLAI